MLQGTLGSIALAALVEPGRGKKREKGISPWLLRSGCACNPQRKLGAVRIPQDRIQKFDDELLALSGKFTQCFQTCFEFGRWSRLARLFALDAK